MNSFIPRGLVALVASSFVYRAAPLNVVPPTGDATGNSTEGRGAAYVGPGLNQTEPLQCRCGEMGLAMRGLSSRSGAAPRPMRKKTIMVTVSVNMAGKLRASLRCNKPLMERIIVITETKDTATQKLCWDEGIECYDTDTMYENGNSFNKGRALQKLQRELLLQPANWGSLVLFVDADICLPSDVWSHVPALPQNRTLYTTTSRCLYDSPETYTAGIVALQAQHLGLSLGMFQAYVLEEGTPLYADRFGNAAGSDGAFAREFPNVTKLDMWVSHLGGKVRRNWTGFLGDAERWAEATPPPDGVCPCCHLPPVVMGHYG